MGEAKRMAVVNAEGVTETVIMIDDDSDWPVPQGCRLVEDKARIAAPGGTLSDVDLARPRQPEPEPEPGPSLADRIAAIEARLAALEAKEASAAR